MSTQMNENPEETAEESEDDVAVRPTIAEEANGEGKAINLEEELSPEPSTEEQISELKDQLLRALAEGENVRRRAEKERADTSRYAITSFARDILSVADNLRRTLTAAADSESENLKPLVEGVEMTERDLLATLERHGIRTVSPLGEKFDHNYHQAMFEIPESGKAPGTIVEVVQAGYVIADRLLRPAMVGIAGASQVDSSGGKASSAEGIDTEA